ncbi:hypothetical protein [Streptomyces albogriseolus]
MIKRGRKIPDGATGLFGDQTRAAYRAEQLAQGFKGPDADGVPGPTFLAALGRLTGFPPRRRGRAFRASHRPGGLARTTPGGPTVTVGTPARTSPPPRELPWSP